MTLNELTQDIINYIKSTAKLQLLFLSLSVLTYFIFTLPWVNCSVVFIVCNMLYVAYLLGNTKGKPDEKQTQQPKKYHY